MTQIEKISDLLKQIPIHWQEDFCLLIEGEETTVEFQAYFDRDETIQGVFDQILHVIDGDTFSSFKERCASS